MERIKNFVKQELDYLKKVDKFIGKWVKKVPMLMFDFLVVVIVTIPALWGLIFMVTQSFFCGFITMLIGAMVGTYLLIKRHKELNNFVNK